MLLSGGPPLLLHNLMLLSGGPSLLLNNLMLLSGGPPSYVLQADIISQFVL